jgi:hypothetical protein
LASTTPAKGDDLGTEVKELRRLVERLNERVERLESALAGKENGANNPAAVNPSPGGATPPTSAAASAAASRPLLLPTPAFSLAPKPAATPFAGVQALSPTEQATFPALRVSLRDQWRGVHRGMTREQVDGVLGPPTRVLEINSKPLWYYEYSFGAGSVAFSQEGLVEDWQRPPLGSFGLW